MPDFTECQCQGDAGCPHHGEPERIQIMPDGTRLPIPDSPRFRWDSAFGAWCWVCDEGHTVWTLPHMRDRMPQEWQSCCAVAALCSVWIAPLPQEPQDNWGLDLCAASRLTWKREFEKADAEMRGA